jgi:single-strand DNA-binding protein
MSNLHKVTGSMIGYVVSVPQVSLVGESRTPRAFYQVIRNIRWNDPDSGERQERKVAIPLTSWGKQAEHDAQYLRKGSHVAVEFRIENSQYEKDGETFYGFQFTVEAIEYLDSKEKTERREQRQREAANS